MSADKEHFQDSKKKMQSNDETNKRPENSGAVNENRAEGSGNARRRTSYPDMEAALYRENASDCPVKSANGKKTHGPVHRALTRQIKNVFSFFSSGRWKQRSKSVPELACQQSEGRTGFPDCLSPSSGHTIASHTWPSEIGAEDPNLTASWNQQAAEVYLLNCANFPSGNLKLVRGRYSKARNLIKRLKLRRRKTDKAEINKPAQMMNSQKKPPPVTPKPKMKPDSTVLPQPELSDLNVRVRADKVQNEEHRAELLRTNSSSSPLSPLSRISTTYGPQPSVSGLQAQKPSVSGYAMPDKAQKTCNRGIELEKPTARENAFQERARSQYHETCDRKGQPDAVRVNTAGSVDGACFDVAKTGKQESKKLTGSDNSNTPVKKENEKPPVSGHQAVKPSTSGPQGVKPSTSGPQGVNASTSAPQGVKPSTSAPQGVKPSTSAPQGVNASTSAPQGVKPSTSAPQGVKPSTSGPQKTAEPDEEEDKVYTPVGVRKMARQLEILFRSRPHLLTPSANPMYFQDYKSTGFTVHEEKREYTPYRSQPLPFLAELKESLKKMNAAKEAAKSSDNAGEPCPVAHSCDPRHKVGYYKSFYRGTVSGASCFEDPEKTNAISEEQSRNELTCILSQTVPYPNPITTAIAQAQSESSEESMKQARLSLIAELKMKLSQRQKKNSASASCSHNNLTLPHKKIQSCTKINKYCKDPISESQTTCQSTRAESCTRNTPEYSLEKVPLSIVSDLSQFKQKETITPISNTKMSHFKGEAYEFNTKYKRVSVDLHKSHMPTSDAAYKNTAFLSIKHKRRTLEKEISSSNFRSFNRTNFKKVSLESKCLHPQIAKTATLRRKLITAADTCIDSSAFIQHLICCYFGSLSTKTISDHVFHVNANRPIAYLLFANSFPPLLDSVSFFYLPPKQLEWIPTLYSKPKSIEKRLDPSTVVEDTFPSSSHSFLDLIVSNNALGGEDGHDYSRDNCQVVHIEESEQPQNVVDVSFNRGNVNKRETHTQCSSSTRPFTTTTVTNTNNIKDTISLLADKMHKRIPEDKQTHQTQSIAPAHNVQFSIRSLTFPRFLDSVSCPDNAESTDSFASGLIACESYKENTTLSQESKATNIFKILCDSEQKWDCIEDFSHSHKMYPKEKHENSRRPVVSRDENCAHDANKTAVTYIESVHKDSACIAKSNESFSSCLPGNDSTALEMQVDSKNSASLVESQNDIFYSLTPTSSKLSSISDSHAILDAGSTFRSDCRLSLPEEIETGASKTDLRAKRKSSYIKASQKNRSHSLPAHRGTQHIHNELSTDEDLRHNVRKWLLSIAPSEVMPLADPLLKASKAHKIQSQESVNLASNLRQMRSGRPASALTLLGERTASDKEQNKSYVQQAFTGHQSNRKSHAQGDKEFIASESLNSDRSTQIVIKHDKPVSTVSLTKELNKNSHLIYRNAEKLQTMDRIYSPLSDYMSCISLDTVCAVPENMQSSGSESFCTAKSSEDMCIDTFLPVSKVKQKEHQSRSIHKQVFSKNSCRPNTVQIKDRVILKRHVPTDLIKHHNAELNDFMNKGRVSPKNCKSKVIISSASNKQSNSSVICHEYAIHNCKPRTSNRVHFTEQLSHSRPFKSPCNSNQTQHSPQLEKCRKSLAEFVNDPESRKGDDLEASCVPYKRIPYLYSEGRNTTGGNREGIDPEQRSEKTNSKKKSLFTAKGPATLSVVTVSKTGLLTTNVCLPPPSTVNKEVQCCHVLPQNDSVRIETAPYQSIVAAKSSVCHENSLTSTGFFVSHSGEEESGAIPPLKVPISDQLKWSHLYEMSNPPRMKREMHNYLDTSKYEHIADKNQDTVNKAKCQSDSLPFLGGAIATPLTCRLLDTKLTVLETTNSTFSHEIQPSPSDEEVARIMCKTYSPFKAGSGGKLSGRKIEVLRCERQRTVTRKVPPTPYPVSPPISVEDEELTVNSDLVGTSVLYPVSHEKRSKLQLVESKYGAGTGCKQKDKRFDEPVNLSPEIGYRALENILADEIMPAGGAENQSENETEHMLSEIEMLLSPFYKEYFCSPCKNKMDDLSCYPNKHLKITASSGQTQTPSMCTHIQRSNLKKNKITSELYQENEEEDMNCNNEDKLCDFTHLLKDLLSCLKEIEEINKPQEEIVKERNDAVELISNRIRLQNTAKLSESDSACPFKAKQALNQTDSCAVPSESAMCIKHAACTNDENLKTLVTNVLQTIRKLKMRESNQTTLGTSAIPSILCKEHANSDALNNKFVPKHDDHGNPGNLNMKENVTMPAPAMELDVGMKKSFSSQNTIENKICAQPDISKPSTLAISITRNRQMNFSRDKPPSTKNNFSNKITEDEITGKTEIMCRYLQIPVSILHLLDSKQVIKADFSNSNTSSDSVCGHSKCNHSKENDMQSFSSAFWDTVQKNDGKRCSTRTMFSQPKSAFDYSKSLPFTYKKAAESAVTSTRHKSKPRADMGITACKFPARSEFAEPQMESVSTENSPKINSSPKTKSLQTNFKSYETAPHSLPTGVSSYTILHHPDWKHFSSIYSTFVENSHFPNDSHNSSNNVLSDTHMKGIHQVLKQKAPAVICGQDNTMFAHYREEKPLSMHGVRKFGLVHSRSIINRVSEKYSTAVPSSEAIVHTLGPAKKTYTLTCTKSSSKADRSFYRKHGSKTNRKASDSLYRATSEMKTTDAASMNGNAVVNTSEVYYSFPQTLGQSKPSAGFQDVKEFAIKNSKGAKGYSLHKKDGKYVWISHNLEQNHIQAIHSQMKTISHSGIDTRSNNFNWFGSSERKNEHQRFTNCTNNGNSNAVPHCHSTLNYCNVCLDSKNENIKLRNMLGNLPATKARRHKQCKWKPKRDLVSPLDEPNAVFVSLCIVSEAVDPVTGQTLLSVTNTQSECCDNNQRLSRCTTMCHRSSLYAHSQKNSVSPNTKNIATKPTESDSNEPQNRAGLPASHQSVASDSVTEGGEDDAVLESRQFYLAEVNEFPAHFSHMSTNQNAADSSPSSSESCDTDDNQPVFSSFTFGSDRVSNPAFQTPLQSHGKLRSTWQCRPSTSEPSVPVSEQSVTTTVSACSSNEKLSLSDKISFFSRKIARLTKRKKSKIPSNVVTHKVTPVKAMVETYKIMARVSNGLTPHKQDYDHSKDAHTSSSNHCRGEFSGRVKDKEGYGILTNKSEKGKPSFNISFNSKLSEYDRMEGTLISNDAKLPTNIPIRNRSKTETKSENLEKDSLQNRRDTYVSRLSCHSTESPCRHRLPCLLWKAPISYIDYQTYRERAKATASPSDRETTNIMGMNSSVTWGTSFQDTNAHLGKKSKDIPNYNKNSSDEETAIMPLKNEITDYERKPKCSSQETGMGMFMGSWTKKKSNFFHPSADPTLANVYRQKIIKHDINKTGSIRAQHVAASKMSCEKTSKRFIPCVTTTQPCTKTTVHKKAISKHVNLKGTKLPVIIRDRFINCRRQCLDESTHILTPDSFDSILSSDRESKVCGKMREAVHADSDKASLRSFESQMDSETMSSGSFEITGESSGHNLSETSDSCDGEYSLKLADVELMSKHIATPEYVDDDKPASSSDSYTTANQDVQMTTKQDHVFNANSQQGMHDVGQKYIYVFRDEPQFDRCYRSHQTSSKLKLISVPVEMGLADMYDCAPVSFSQESSRNERCNRSSNFCFRHRTRSHVYDECKHGLSGIHRTPSDYLPTCQQCRDAFQHQCLRHHDCDIESSTTDKRVCRFCNCTRNIRYQHLSEKSMQSATAAFRSTANKKTQKISNEINLSKSMIALSKSPILNLPKYIGKLARFLKKPVSNWSIFARNDMRSMRPLPEYGDTGKDTNKMPMSHTGKYCAMESNTHMCKSTTEISKQDKSSGHPNAMRQEERQISKFQSPIADCTENTSYCSTSVAGASQFLVKQNCFRFEEQPKLIKHHTTIESRESKSRSIRTQRRRTSADLQKSGKKSCPQTSAHANKKHSPAITATFPVEDQSKDTFYSINSKHNKKSQHRSKTTETNLSKNANDEVYQQMINFHGQHTFSEGVLEHGPWSTHRSQKIPLNVNSNKSGNKIKNSTMTGTTSATVPTEMRSSVAAIEGNAINEHDNPTKKRFIHAPRTRYSMYSTDVFMNPSSFLDDYVSIKTGNVSLSNKIYSSPQVTMCKNKREYIKNSASESYIRSSQNILKSCTMLPSKSQTRFNRHSFKPEKPEMDLNKCGSQEVAKQSTLLSSEGGFNSYVKVKRGCLKMYDSASYNEPSEFLDSVAHLKDSKHVFDNKTQCGKKLTNIILDGGPVRFDKTQGAPDSDLTVNNCLNQDKNVNKILTTESRQLSDESTGIPSVKVHDNMFEEKIEVLTLKHDDDKGISQTKKPESPQSNAHNDLHQPEKKINAHEQNSTEYTEVGIKPQDHLTLDDTEETKESYNQSTQGSGEKHTSMRAETQWPNVDSAQPKCKSQDRECANPHSPKSKFDLLRPSSEVQTVTTVRRTTRVCPQECFYSPKKEDRCMGANSQNYQRQFPRVHRKTPRQENHQAEFLQEEAKCLYKGLCGQCVAATMNAVTTHGHKGFDLSAHEQNSLACIRTNSVKFSPHGQVKNHQMLTACENRAKNRVDSYDPHTFPGKVQISKKYCKFTSHSQGKYKFTHDELKPVNIGGSAAKTQNKKGKLIEESPELKSAKCNTAQWLSSIMGGEYSNKTDNEEMFLSIPLFTKFFSPAYYNKQSATKRNESLPAIKHSYQKHRHLKMLRVLKAGKKVSFTDNCKKSRQHHLHNSKTISASSKCNTMLSVYSFDALSSLSSDEEESSQNSEMNQRSKKKHSPVFPSNKDVCQIDYGPTRFESCISLCSSDFQSDTHVTFPDQDNTKSQSRRVQKMSSKSSCKPCVTQSNNIPRSDRVKSCVDFETKHMKEFSTDTSCNAHPQPRIDILPARTSMNSRSRVKRTAHVQSDLQQNATAFKGLSKNNNGVSSKKLNLCPYHYRGISKSNPVQSYSVRQLKSVSVPAVEQPFHTRQGTSRKHKSSRYDYCCSEYRTQSEYDEMSQTQFKTKDKNSNKKTSFRIIAEPPKDKKAPPSFKIELSPLSTDSSDEPVTRHAKMEEMKSPNKAAKFKLTEIKRQKQTLSNATRHSFPSCAYKSSQTTAHAGSTTSKTLKLLSDSSLASTSSSSTSHAPSTEKKIIIQTKSPPKQPSVSSPRVYEVTATIQNREPTPALVKENMTHTVSHCIACDPTSPVCNTVRHTISSVSILPSNAKTRLASPLGPQPSCSRQRHTCRTFTRATISSDSALDLMAEALTNLKQNPPAKTHKTCPRRGIKNFRLARKSSCSVVSAVASCCSVEDDNQLRTTHSFSLKRNTTIKRLSSDQTHSKRRLRQATRALRTQEILLRLVRQTHSILKHVMVGSRREIVEEKNRMRQRQLQIAMKIASYKSLLRKSQLPPESSSSSEPLCVGGFSFESYANTDFDTYESVSVTRSPCDSNSPDLISVQTTSGGDDQVIHKPGCVHSGFSQSDTYSDLSSAVQQPVVDKLCSCCLLMGLNKQSTKPKKSRKRTTCPSCSTQIFKLNRGNHNNPSISLSNPSLNKNCPTHRLNFRTWPQISKSDSSVTYTLLTNITTESKKSTDRKETVWQGKYGMPFDQRDANIPCEIYGKFRPREMHCFYRRERNRNESKKSTLTKKCSVTHSTSLVRVHENYFTHLQELAQQMAAQALKDASKYRPKMKKTQYCARETKYAIRYLLTLKDISHIVAAVCMTAANQGITADWKKFCSVLLHPGTQVSLTTVQSYGHSSDVTPDACFRIVNPPAKPSKGFVISNQNRDKKVTLSKGCVKNPTVGKSELSNYGSCYSSSRSPSMTVQTKGDVQKERYLSKSIISLSLKDSSSRDGHIPHNCCTSNRASVSYQFKPTSATQSTAKNPQEKREDRNAWRHLSRSHPDTMCLVEHYQESIEKTSSSLSSGSIQTRTERRASKLFISTLPEAPQRCSQHRRSKPFSRRESHQNWIPVPTHGNKPLDYPQTSTIKTDRFYRPVDYSKMDSHMRKTDFEDAIELEAHCCTSRTCGSLAKQHGHGPRSQSASISPKHTICTTRTDRAISGHVTKCADINNDSMKPSKHKYISTPNDCRHGQSNIHIDLSNGYKIASQLKSTRAHRKNENLVQYGDGNDSQPECRTHHERDNQPAQHKSRTKRKLRPNYHTEDFVEMPSLSLNRTPHDHLSSFHETKKTAYKHSNYPVDDHRDSSTVYENYAGSSGRIKQSFFPHDAKIGHPSLGAHEHHKHHSERHHHTADCHWNQLRHQHHISKDEGCKSLKALPNAYPPTNRSAKRGQDLEREVQHLVERNMRTLARRCPREAGRLSYQQLLWANNRVLDSLQPSTSWEADSLNRAFRDAVYRGYLQLHQPDMR